MRKRSSAQLWLLARRVHFMAGVLVAPFLAVLALTGLWVEAQTGSPRPLSEQVGAALAAHPDAHVTSVVPAEDPDRTTGVLGGIEGLKQTGSPFASELLTVYVDPYPVAEAARDLVSAREDCRGDLRLPAPAPKLLLRHGIV